MSGFCVRTILNNEPVSKRKRGNDYTAPKSPESSEAPKEDPCMAGQDDTAEQIAAIIAQVTLAMSRARDEEEDNKSILWKNFKMLSIPQMKKKTTKVFIWCIKKNLKMLSIPQMKKKTTKVFIWQIYGENLSGKVA